MTTRIFKYPLEPDRRQMIMMPRNAKPIAVYEINTTLVMYAEVPQHDEYIDRECELAEELADILHKDYVDPFEMVPRIFVVVTTGDTFAQNGKQYIGTTVLGGWFVAHVYEQDGTWKDPIDLRSAEDFASIKSELSNPS